MKNDLAYWEKNKEHLQKHFLDWEKFVHAGKLSNAPSPESRFTLFAVSVLAYVPLLICWALPLFFRIVWLVFAIFVSFAIGSAIADRLLHPYWMVQTTRAIYVCHGEDCELIFECSFSAFYRMRYILREKKIYVELYSDSFPGAGWGDRGIPKCGKETLKENKLRKKQGLPLERKLYSLSHLTGWGFSDRSNPEPGFYAATIPADSGIFEAMLKITDGFPGLERRDVTPPSFLKSYKE